MQQNKIKSLGNSNDGAYQKTGRNEDNTLGIPRANLELKICSYYVNKMFIVWSFVHNLFQFRAIINH